MSTLQPPPLLDILANVSYPAALRELRAFYAAARRRARIHLMMMRSMVMLLPAAAPAQERHSTGH